MSALILVVEDEDSIRESVSELLADEGYRVEQAANGVEALAKLQRETPQLVILDLWMPVMTGADVLKKMRADARLASIPVVVLTAASDAPPSEPGVEVLRKPVLLEALLKAIARNLI